MDGRLELGGSNRMSPTLDSPPGASRPVKLSRVLSVGSLEGAALPCAKAQMQVAHSLLG